MVEKNVKCAYVHGKVYTYIPVVQNISYHLFNIALKKRSVTQNSELKHHVCIPLLLWTIHGMKKNQANPLDYSMTDAACIQKSLLPNWGQLVEE